MRVINTPSIFDAKNVSNQEPTFNDATLDKWELLLTEVAANKGATTMDAFAQDPFASQARMYSVAKREWLWREFGDPIPGTLEAWVATIWRRTKKNMVALCLRKV